MTTTSDPADPHHEPHWTRDWQRLRRELRHAVFSTLSRKEYAVVLLRYWGRMNMTQIARLLSVHRTHAHTLHESAADKIGRVLANHGWRPTDLRWLLHELDARQSHQSHE